MPISPQHTVGELVAERPARARIFERFGIDYCCGGRKPLADACAARGVPTDRLLEALVADERTAAPSGVDWTRAPLAELADHIEQTHHAYLKQELPRLLGLTRKVAAVHGERHPEWAELAEEYRGFAEDMASHMMKEERVLFPWIRGLERGGRAAPVAAPIAVLEHEHEEAGRSLDRMDALTAGFGAPPEACATVRAMLEGLARLKADTHEHVHKENNILFPRAAAMQEATP